MKKKILLLPVLLFLFFYSKAQADKFVVSYDVFTTKLKAQGKPQIIDVRSAEEFAINHIVGATNIDISIPGYRQQLQNLSREAPVFIYAINTGRSGKLASELGASGYNDVYVLNGGIANWIGSGGAYFSSVGNNITPSAFAGIINADKPVLIEFGSRYCGACRRGGQIIDSLKTKFDNVQINVLNIDINDNAKLIAGLHFIRAVPTFVLYRKGAIAWKKEGIESLPAELSGIINDLTSRKK